MSKETRLNIRITPEFQKELQMIARFHGLTLTSYVHSTLVQRLRQEKAKHPEAFSSEQRSDVATEARYTPSLQNLGTIDRPDLVADAVAANKLPDEIMNEWLAASGSSVPEGYSIQFFGGWENWSQNERIEAIHDARKVLERTLRQPRIGEIRPIRLRPDAPIKQEIQKMIDDVEINPKKRKVR